MPSYSIEQDLATMKPGEEHHYEHSSGTYKVRYESEQAMGDNNLPAKGYTVGHYHVEGPTGTKSFRHTPHGPTLMEAKPYAARQAAQHIISETSAAQHRDVHPRSGRLGM